MVFSERTPVPATLLSMKYSHEPSEKALKTCSDRVTLMGLRAA
jgi:hypothetical protein